MEIENTHSNKYDLLPRLYRLIHRLSEDQQLRLLRKLLADDLTAFLFKAVIDLPETKRAQLLAQLSQTPENIEPIKTVNLDEDNVSLRGHLRKRCLISAQLAVDQQVFSGHILDISTVGLFIETEEPMPIGQRLTVRFALPGTRDSLELKGGVVWLASNGVGIRLEPIDAEQEARIRSYVEAS